MDRQTDVTERITTPRSQMVKKIQPIWKMKMCINYIDGVGLCV